MNNLASTYSNLGKWNEAEELEVHVLEICTKLLGGEHPDTLRSMNNIAMIYSNLGKWNEAKELQVHVLKIHTKVLGN
ncbi:Tetratricopeptide repeat-domain-containing protein [Cyathus striatus]|nr:Tetratricopeptide repeat-domain-containing protein [Cyathus striatus]